MASKFPLENESSIEHQYFYEDEVFHLDKKKIKFGLVIETFEVISDEVDEVDALKSNEIRVVWHPDGIEQVMQENAVGLADRTLMPGDVVRRLVPGKDTQRGYCREIFVKADVRVIGTKYVIKNVSSDRLQPLITMPRDNAVCFDSWVGSTKNIAEKLILKSSCGSVLELRPDIEYCPLKDIVTKSRCGFFAGTLFYPGQVLVGPISELDNAKWITTSPEMRTSRKHKTVDRKFTVQSVEIEGVWVHWQCKASCDVTEDINGIQQPQCYITGENLKRLKRLNLFESCMLQINDKNFVEINEQDVIVSKSQWKKEQSNKYCVLMNQLHLSNILKPKNSQKWKDELTVKTSTIDICDNIKLTTTESDSIENAVHVNGGAISKILNECDKNKLCPSARSSKLTKERSETTTNSRNQGESDEWLTDDDDSMSDSGTTTTASSCSSNATPKSSPKKSPLLANKIRKLRKKHARSSNAEKIPKMGEKLVTESLVVYSTATVVWQDGTIETDIQSTELCPIHHLDDHEFFPGDFVLSANDTQANTSFRDYGVIQGVDHLGRTALVKWFSTYSCIEEPKPTFKGETEVSVYDLKDHPDFQYRPGTIVIRVANFIGEDSLCTAGQVIDNYPEGRVKVWWVDGHTSLCWPQDLFEVGQYDSENNFWSNADSDNDSWVTEDETSEPGGNLPEKEVSKPQIVSNLERARVAMSRLEEMFMINPSLQNQEVMKKLLMVYKKCRYLDRLMNTSFFHEENFMGLLERVRKSGCNSTADRVQDQKNRLFNQTSPSSKGNFAFTHSITSSDSKKSKIKPQSLLEITKSHSHSNEEDSGCSSYGSTKSMAAGTGVSTNQSLMSSSPIKKDSFLLHPSTSESKPKSLNISTSSDISSIDCESELPKFSATCAPPQVKDGGEKCSLNQPPMTSTTKENTSSNCSSTAIDDSGNFSTTDNEIRSYFNDRINNVMDKVNNYYMKQFNEKSISTTNCTFSIVEDDLSNEFVCAKLCALIKMQLVKAMLELTKRFGEPDTVKEILGKLDSTNNIRLINVNGSNTENENEESVEEATKSTSNASDSLDTEEAAETTAEPNLGELSNFHILETAPPTHKYHLTVFQTINAQHFYKSVQKEHKLLRSSLPPGVHVRTFEDRLDLLSIMIEGPQNTPYEGGLFFFDIQLGREYPNTPPLCHYISYCTDRLNPNLYEDGKVCVSLLGTWSGRGTEVWSSTNSTLLQVIVSIQGLILVDEPYFNEAGYEKQRGTQQGQENSRMYNEMVVLKMLQSMTKLMTSPPEVFREEAINHFKSCGKDMYDRITKWMDTSNKYNNPNKQDSNNMSDANSVVPIQLNSNSNLPDFPLVPASRGFCLTLSGLLDKFWKQLQAISDK